MTTPSGLTLDAGALIGVERSDRRLRVLLDEAERAGWPIVVPVGPLAQVWRDGARQAVLARFLSATDRVSIVEWDAATARAAGVLCGRVGTSDVVDASVALCARERGHHILTSDPQDFARIDPALPLTAPQQGDRQGEEPISEGHRRLPVKNTMPTAKWSPSRSRSVIRCRRSAPAATRPGVYAALRGDQVRRFADAEFGVSRRSSSIFAVERHCGYLLPHGRL